MKILWLSHLIPYPPKGGVLQRSYNLIKELSRYHEIDLLAFNQRSLIASFFNTIESGIEEAKFNLKPFCQRLKFLDIPSYRSKKHIYFLATKSLFHEPYNINWLKSKEYLATMKQWVSDKNYDLIHFDTISLLPYFNLITNETSTSLDHHNIESHMLFRRAKNEQNPIKKIYFWQEGLRLTRYEQRFCPGFSINITCSDVDSRRLIRLAPQANVCTIPNGVDLEYFKPNDRPEKSNRILFVGTMNWYPNIEAVQYIAENLWPTLKQTYPELECDIVGANPPDMIYKYSKKYSDFHIHGFVDDVRPYMEAATLYVCPIQDGGGTKLKILDAMAMGKAIVAHPIACEGIHVTHDIDVLLAEKPNKFIEHINQLLHDSSRRKSLGDAARQTVVKSYGFHTIGKKLAEAFQSSLFY